MPDPHPTGTPPVPATEETPPGAGGPIDLRRVVAEVYDDVRRRRASGDIPASLERELDAAFAQFAPPAAVGDDLAIVIERAERASFIDVDVPTASNRPGVQYVKQALRKTQAWYLRYVAQQVSALGSATTRALKLLETRLAAVEAATPSASAIVLDELGSLPPPAPAAGQVEAVVAALTAAPLAGRVLVADCGEGSVLHALAGRGLNAYGTEPRRELHLALLDGPDGSAVDVRPETALDHLRRIPAGALGAVVLVGVVDASALPTQLALADAADAAVVAGGPIVIVGSDPATFAAADPVRADLTPGRPLHPETWAHILRTRGRTLESTAPVVVAR